MEDKMNKKFFFFDIDGTLTNKTTGEIVPSAKLALDLLQENGHFVALATGRAHYKARKVMESFELKNMVCAGGAGIVINDILIENKPLDFDRSIELINQAEALGYGVLATKDDTIDVYSKNNLFREQVGDRQEPTVYHIKEDLSFDEFTDIFKIYVSIPEKEEHLLTKKNNLGHMRFVHDYLMFQYDDKKAGIEYMMKKINAPISDVVVFGDDTNDLNMFDSQWMNVAMGNAVAELQGKADYITDTNLNDGIYNACKYFNWI